MQALSQATPAASPTLILIIIAAVILVVFWQTILKFGIAVLIIGFVFLLVTGVLDIAHVLHALVP
jgi:hypothetical protein